MRELHSSFDLSSEVSSMHLTYILVCIKTFCVCVWFSPSTWAGEILAPQLPGLAQPASSQRSSLLPGVGCWCKRWWMLPLQPAWDGASFRVEFGEEEIQKANQNVLQKVCPIPNSSGCLLRFGVCVGLLATVVWHQLGVCFAQEKSQELFYGDFWILSQVHLKQYLEMIKLYWIPDCLKIKTGKYLFFGGCLGNLIIYEVFRAQFILLGRKEPTFSLHFKRVLDQTGIKLPA